MPLNESKRKVRERWPLAFDLEGIPRDTATRQQLLNQQQILETIEKEQSMSVPLPRNHFATDIQQDVVTDINDPKVARYGTPKNPFRAYPKMVYHHESGHVLVVQNEAQHAAATRRGFQVKPAPDRDYSRVRSGMVAPVAAVGPERETLLTNEQIENQEAAALAELEPDNMQSADEAEDEIASALGESGSPDPTAENVDAGSRRRKR